METFIFYVFPALLCFGAAAADIVHFFYLKIKHQDQYATDPKLTYQNPITPERRFLLFMAAFVAMGSVLIYDVDGKHYGLFIGAVMLVPIIIDWLLPWHTIIELREPPAQTILTPPTPGDISEAAKSIVEELRKK